MATPRLATRENARLNVRPAESVDDAALAARGFMPPEGRELLIVEDGKSVVGAVAFGSQAFESAELEMPVARIDRIACWGDEEALDALVAACLARLRVPGTHLVSCRVAEADRVVLQVLQDAGFAVIECLLTLGRPIGAAGAMPEGIALASADDAGACAEIAGRAFACDRFHGDPAIADQAADRLKAAWARNDCAGRADATMVARDGGRIVGFNACLLSDARAVIDLIAVAPDAQGRGWGRKLVEGALVHHASKATEMRVGTQSRNLASLALYQACGFKVAQSALTLHAHLKT